MRKKLSSIASLILVSTLSLSLAACGQTSPAEESIPSVDTPQTETPAEEKASEAETAEEKASEAETAESKKDTVSEDFKVGLICLHDESSPYDNNFIKSLETASEQLNLSDSQIVIKTNIPESDDCTKAVADLVSSGCDIIFADSFGHETYLLKAAGEYPDVQFCHATGTLAHTEKKDNFHDAFASIYQGRYLSGVAAGMKLNAMIEEGKIKPEEAVIGYVGAYTYAEVISGYTAFYLGAKSVCPTAVMKVQFTGSWYDETAEKEAAEKLISEKCVLISQHADSMGAPNACEEAGIPNIAYNDSLIKKCPNTFIVSSRINWTPYYVYAIESTINGDSIDTDWVGDLKTESVLLTDVNTQAAAEGTQDKIDEITKKLESGDIHVFDTSSFTVDGKQLDSYMADVDTDDAYTPDTEVIKDGYFHESEYRSAPYFDLRIDGITLLNEKF